MMELMLVPSSALDSELLRQAEVAPARQADAAFPNFAFGAGFIHALAVTELAAALMDDGLTKKKRVRSIYEKLDIDLAALVVPESAFGIKTSDSPFWHDHAQWEEAFLSRKQISAIRDEIADAWKSMSAHEHVIDGNHDWTGLRLPDVEHLHQLHEVAHVILSETAARGIELAIKSAVKKRVRRIRKFAYRRTRAILRNDDAARVAIHRYRVRTGISPPEMEPNWTMLSSTSASYPFSRENSHAYVRRRTNRRCFQRETPERCSRKRRAPSRQTDRHLASSHQA